MAHPPEATPEGFPDLLSPELPFASRHGAWLLLQAERISGMGVWEYDPETGRLSWSPGMYRLFEMTPGEGELEPEAVSTRVPPEDWKRLSEGMEEALQTGRFSMDHRVIWPDGSVRHLVEQAERRPDPDTGKVRLLGTALDVTERVRADEAQRRSELEVRDLAGRLRKKVQELAEADRRKDEFLALLGHELRNPLAPMRNALDALHFAGCDARTLEWSHRILSRQVDHLTRLVDDLLEVSRISRGKVQLSLEDLDLGAAAARAVEQHRPAIEARGQHLVLDAGSEVLTVRADSARLGQVFGNLLHNASKYTDPGGRIDVVVGRSGASGIVRVRDTGVGIPEELFDRIFDMFVQADRSLDRAQGGLGLGLPLVRRLVEQHGGQVTVQSQGPGQGSEFTVRLPLANAATLPADPRPSSDAAPEARRRRILVVDDNRDAAESLGLLLEMAGHEVFAAHSGPEALEVWAARHPDLVLLDIGLPGLDGYEVAARIRKEPLGASVVLVALTGYGQDEDRRRALAAGFDYHFTKPVGFEALAPLLEGP